MKTTVLEYPFSKVCNFIKKRLHRNGFPVNIKHVQMTASVHGERTPEERNERQNH